ncbi:uncharacterized protein LOC119298918 [Triticum dicoccoides]|uniref:uncharacterized protein LOC119298918 n=1 Tax=Triticum dicoccoides TaxID=85692 RepID=UPI00188F9890|nr:uncharacterized protein LOC119298918 [Triticum dicoccoides]
MDFLPGLPRPTSKIPSQSTPPPFSLKKKKSTPPPPPPCFVGCSVALLLRLARTTAAGPRVAHFFGTHTADGFAKGHIYTSMQMWLDHVEACDQEGLHLNKFTRQQLY